MGLLNFNPFMPKGYPRKKNLGGVVGGGGGEIGSHKKFATFVAFFKILSNQKHCHILNALDFIYYSWIYTCVHDCLHVCMFNKHG